MIDSVFFLAFLAGIIGGLFPALILAIYLVYKYRKIKEKYETGFLEIFDN